MNNYQQIDDPEAGNYAAGTSSSFQPPLAATTGDQVAVNRYETSLGMRVDIESVLCYVLGCISGVVFLIAEQKNDYVRFHAWQSCLLFFIMLIFHLIFIWQTVVSIILGVIDLGLICFLGYKAYANAQTLERFKLPLLGYYASKWVDAE